MLLWKYKPVTYPNNFIGWLINYLTTGFHKIETEISILKIVNRKPAEKIEKSER